MSEKMKDLKNFNPRALIDKYSVKKKSTDNGYSSFWMGDTLDSYSSIFDDEDLKPKVDLIALSSYSFSLHVINSGNPIAFSILAETLPAKDLPA